MLGGRLSYAEMKAYDVHIRTLFFNFYGTLVIISHSHEFHIQVLSDDFWRFQHDPGDNQSCG